VTTENTQTENVECRLSRRGLLQFGGLGGLGINLPGLFRAQAAQAARLQTTELPVTEPRSRIKSCIVIFYYGGPSHLDTFDMKPNAPAEVRGEFQSIATSVPGLRICEHLPHTARIMHKISVIRSMHHSMRLHDAACVATLTGRPPARGDGENSVVPNESSLFPCYGASLSYLRRDVRLAVSHAALPFVIRNVVQVPCQTGGFLGNTYSPFLISGDTRTMGYRADMLKLPDGLTLDRLHRRNELLKTIDAKSDVGSKLVAIQLRAHYDKAFELLASNTVQRALDIDREDPRIRDRYGSGPRNQSYSENPDVGNGAELGIGRNMRGQNLLLARRLVEAGVPFVNVYDFKQQGKNWDSHQQNFKQHKNHLLPRSDQAFAALIEDLDERGLLDSTLVIALGEFGRTPKINSNAGRDHWPDCYSVVIAGGGVKGGFVHGSSDKTGAYPKSDPVTPGDLAATIFHCFGIDPATKIYDHINLPYKIADGQPIRQLLDRDIS